VEYVGRGRAKLLLFGEHAAVYGYPAVGLSLEARLRVRLRHAGNKQWNLRGVSEEDQGKIHEVLALLEEECVSGGKAKVGGGVLELESNIPRGLGFGSSASLCVALASALASVNAITDSTTIWQWAHRAEQLFHGTPSGIDTGLALLDGLYRFRPDPPNLPSAERLDAPPLHLVVGAVPRRDSAGRLIAALRRRVTAGEPKAGGILRRLGELADRAAGILKSPAGSESGLFAAQLGELAREAQEQLHFLDLSTPELERHLVEGRKCGALGGKLSGAGGGGAFFLVCRDSESTHGVAEALKLLSVSEGLSTADSIYPITWQPGV